MTNEEKEKQEWLFVSDLVNSGLPDEAVSRIMKKRDKNKNLLKEIKSRDCYCQRCKKTYKTKLSTSQCRKFGIIQFGPVEECYLLLNHKECKGVKNGK